MKTPNTLFALLLLSFLTLTAKADFTNAKCAEVLIGNDMIQISRQWDTKAHLCLISITPRIVKDLKYRDYYFDSTGFFMVFNSYGEGPEAETAGARAFYLFPVTEQYPDYSFEPNSDVIIKLVSGHQLRISGKDFSIVSLSDGLIQEKPLAKDNAGGVELQLKKGFWLDAGFRMGGTRLDNPANHFHMLSSSSDKVCSVKNEMLFNYPMPSNFELKYTGVSLLDFVQRECPQLHVK